MDEEMQRKVALAIAALKELEPEFKKLEFQIYRQMYLDALGDAGKIFLHFANLVSKTGHNSSGIITQLEELERLDKTLSQLRHLQVLPISIASRCNQMNQPQQT